MQAREGDNPKKSSGCGERRQSGNVWRKENCLREGEKRPESQATAGILAEPGDTSPVGRSWLVG